MACGGITFVEMISVQGRFHLLSQKKYPNAGKTQVWQRVFLQTRRWQNKETGEHHIAPSVIQRTLHEAVLRLGIPKPINPPDANPPKCCSYKVVAAGFHALSTENVSYLVKIGLICLSMMYFGGYYGRKMLLV